MLQPGTLLVFMFTYKKSSCNSSFTAVPTCCEPAALLSAGRCLQESSVSLFVLLAQKLFFWLPTCNPGQHPSRGARSSKTPPSLRLSVLPPSCCLYSPKDFPFNLSTTALPRLVLRQPREGRIRHFSSPQNKAVGCWFSSFSFLSKAGLTALHMAAQEG